MYKILKVFRNSITRITIIVSLAGIVASVPVLETYATVESLQSEIDSLNSEINDLENQKKDAQKAKDAAQSDLSNANSKISSISGAMGDLDAEIEGVDQELIGILTDIDLIQSDIEAKTEQIAQTEEEYDEAVKVRDEQYETMKIRIRYMYEQGDATYISIFIEAATSLADALNKADYVEQLYAYDRQMLEQYMATVEYTKDVWDRLEEEKSELEISKEELEGEQQYLEELEAQLQEEYENYGVMLAQARQQAAIFTTRINQQTNEIRQLEREEAEKKREAQEKEREKAAEEQRLIDEANAAAAAAEGGDNTATTTSSNQSSSSSSGGSKVTVSGSGTGVQIANYALQFLGNPYVAGGTSLTNGADCSGFTQSVYKAFGYNIPRTSYAQSSYGRAVSYAEAQPGDIIYYGGHVGIYIGGGQIVHASSQRTGIKISSATYRSIVTVRRII